MRKIFSILAVLAALCCMTSCNLDKVETFVFSFDGGGYITDEDDWKAAQTYFQENYFGQEHSKTFTCLNSEAMDKAITLFTEGIERADDDYILSLIKTEDDVIELDGMLTSGKSNVVVGYRIWNYSQKEQPTAE